MVFYPKGYGPQTEMQQMAMLHSQLGAAYSIIAQYEQAEREREDAARSKSMRDMMSRPMMKTHIGVDKSTHVGPAHPCLQCDELEKRGDEKSSAAMAEKRAESNDPFGDDEDDEDDGRC